MKDDGKGKVEDIPLEEHPKSQIEVMSNTQDSVMGYAAAKSITEEQAALILILNELRCIHWHFDAMMAQKEEVKT